MTEKQKQLLVKALCGYLPYGLKIYREKPSFLDEEGRHIQEVQGIDIELEILLTNTFARIEEMKPYLRPMSSMTEEEDMHRCAFLDDIEGGVSEAIPNYIDWLNENHFDYRGLIGKGLAIEAPEGMYGTTTKTL